MSACTCHPVPERYHTTHYGATEPGSTLEPDYDCPVHFPPDATVIGNASVRLRDAEKEVTGTCLGYEVSPNLCRCPCEGCKYHCAAHDVEEVGPIDPA